MTMTSPTERIVAAALSSPQTVHVPVFAGFFDADVTIHVGDTVQWDWVFPLFHDITTVNGSAESFDSGVLTDTYSHTFLRPETIVYYCRIHGFDNFDGTATGMTATVTVLPAVPEPAGIAALAAGAAAVACRRRRRRRALSPLPMHSVGLVLAVTAPAAVAKWPALGPVSPDAAAAAPPTPSHP